MRPNRPGRPDEVTLTDRDNVFRGYLEWPSTPRADYYPGFHESAGPWECTDAGGVQGIFISGSTRLKEVESQQKVAWQNIDILVYSHRGSEQKMGYFALGHDDSTAGVRFDGKNLAIHFSGKPTTASPPHLSAFDLDLTFDRATKQWNGAWSMCDKAGGATLERPHPGNSVQPGFLAG